MSDYGVTDKGFQMRRLDEIYTDICKRFKDEVGVDPSENPQSVMNVLFTIFADAPAELWEAYAAAYQQLFPNTACGVALDNVMQVGGVSRIGQAKTKYFISCTGQEGTVIPVGALIQSSSRPQRTFQAVSASIISSANWRKLAIRPIESIAGTFTFDFGVSRNATSGEVGTYAESSSVTKKMTVSSYDDAYSQMLAAVQSFDALVKFGIAVSDETDDQGEHSIVLTASGAADSFSATLCKYITVTEVTSNIQFESAEYGSYVLADGVITQIVTTVDGWTACTNDIAPIKGRLTQTDAEARTSYTNRVASRGTGTVASIVSLLYSDVDGVTFAAGYENYNDTTDAAGRPPHSIEIVVQGGSDEDVANIIWKNKAGGIRAYGKHYAYATDINGNRQYLEFTRVNDVYLLLSVTVTSSGGLDDDYAARIKSLLMEEILSAAETVTVAVPAWLLAVVAFLGTLLGGAISFAVNQILIKGAADRAAKKREKDDERRRERYILQMDSRKATFDLLSCICAGIERMETETGQIYWNGELKRSLAHLEGVDERYRESDQRQLADLNTRSK